MTGQLYIQSVIDHVPHGLPLRHHIALELRSALDALGEVLGRLTPDDLLGRVFATFCIGK